MAVTADELDLPRRTLMWVAGAFLSMFLFAAVIALSYTLGAREGGFGDPPLIRAAEGPYKIVPEQPGGQSFPHQRIGVYDRVSGDQTAMAEDLMPPSEQPVSPKLIPGTAPRVVDEQQIIGNPFSAELSVVLPTPKNQEVIPNKPASDESATNVVTALIPENETSTEIEDAKELASEQGLPPSGPVDEDQIAGLIRQNTTTETANPEIQISTLPSSVPSLDDSQKIETVEGTTLSEPVIPQASQLEPVVAEVLMVDPARVVDDKPDMATAMEIESTEPPKPAAEPQTTTTAPEILIAAPEVLPQNKPAASALATSVPEATQPAQANGLQVAALDLTDTTPKETAVEAMPAGSFLIQIGAFRKKSEAESAWRRASKTHKDLIAQFRPSIQRADLGKRGIYYRLRAGPLENKAQARSLCKLLQQRKLACLVPKP